MFPLLEGEFEIAWAIRDPVIRQLNGSEKSQRLEQQIKVSSQGPLAIPGSPQMLEEEGDPLWRLRGSAICTDQPPEGSESTLAVFCPSPGSVAAVARMTDHPPAP